MNRGAADGVAAVEPKLFRKYCNTLSRYLSYLSSLSLLAVVEVHSKVVVHLYHAHFEYTIDS